jgi:energy-coupling factor transporter ATP-binding protein EcfA2
MFSPRPEAQATTWDELMPPVQMAVRDLLVRIHGAHYSVRNKNTGKSAVSSILQTGNCFLVYGSRGTGKTTVLLNAQRAVSQKSDKIFFKEAPDETSTEKKIREEKETPDEIKVREAKENAKENAESLRKDGIVWLDILNLEPIPSEANLLTILLTQVRNSLHSYSDKRQRDQRSVFEGEANSAQQLLNKLINDTTLMWQNITEPDTRNISARQVKAADIYAGFSEKFKKAMDKLIEELSDTRGSDSKVSIVLPIDSIDRSTEHLQSIVKLAQLVSHPNLWLVMAGDRVEVETFLERAYWKELIRSSVGASERGKINSDGEDEALVIARRQANATAQKLWPANHRVEIDFLTPDQTLAFEYKNNFTISPNTEGTLNIERQLYIKTPCAEYKAHLEFRCKCYSANNKATIRNLLANIPIPTTDEQRKRKDSSMNLLNLFYVEKEVTGKVTGEIIHKYLARAAHHGLSLPARSVLDLWQLLDWLVYDTSSRHDFRAEKVARTMLRNVISSSDMPNAVAQDLQTYILRRGEKHGTILYFEDDISLNVTSMTSTNNDFEYALTPVFSKEPNLRSRLEILNIEDIVLELRFDPSITPLDSSKNQYPQAFVTEHTLDNEKRRIELPPLVAAWLMVLYDILILAEATASSWVIGSPKLDDNYLNVSVQHSVIQAGKYRNIEPLYWAPPAWGLFLGRNIFSLRWQNFRKDILKTTPRDRDLVTKLLAAGWILCALKTSVELMRSIDARFYTEKHDDIEEQKKDPVFDLSKLPEFSPLKSEHKAEANKLEIDAIQYAELLYQKIQSAKNYQLTQEQADVEQDKIEQYKIIPAAYEIMLATEKWLKDEFLYFLNYAYVPVESENSKNRFDNIWKELSKEEGALTNHWKENLTFILATIEEKFAEADNADNGDIKITETTTETIKEEAHIKTIRKTIETKKTIEPLGKLLFADLYNPLENPISAGKP